MNWFLTRYSPLFLLFAVALVSAEAFGDYPIAGVEPFQRPAGAPVIKEPQKSGDWQKIALHGVEKPYPSSLRFLDDQGGWYTPFTKPGMLGRYDIRGWHTDSQ